jgi:hypothetical protein
MSSNDRVILEQFVSQAHQQRAPSLSKSQFFEIFVSEQVLKDSDLSYEELESGLVAGGRDGGIDAAYTFVNGELAREDSDFGSSLLKRDEDYERLFSETYPLALYRVCISILKSVDTYLREKTDLDPKERNNIRFYMAMWLSAQLSNSRNPAISQISAIQLDQLADPILERAYSEVYEIYRESGGTDQVAKGADLLLRLQISLNAQLA